MAQAEKKGKKRKSRAENVFEEEHENAFKRTKTEEDGEIGSDTETVSKKSKKTNKRKSVPDKVLKIEHNDTIETEENEASDLEESMSDTVTLKNKDKKNKKAKLNKLLAEGDMSKRIDNEEDKESDNAEAASDSEALSESNEEGANPQAPLEILSDTTFETLKEKVSEKTLKAVTEMGFTRMTEIQARTIPTLLLGKDLVGAAKTGSGKTLAFLIPAIELINTLKFKSRNGTGAVIITPTRELAMQTFQVLKQLMKYQHNTYGILMGGALRKQEERKLFNGLNIIVATPGRLLDHMQRSPNFVYKNLVCLIIDEADLMLDIGFEAEMRQIIHLLPKRRQTILFSATQTSKVDTLKSIVFRKEPIYVGVDDAKPEATVSGLTQAFLLCPPEKRFSLLFTFLQKHSNKKVMVFFNSCASVQFHSAFLNYINLTVTCIHGNQKQAQRTSTFFKFCKTETGILLCTDIAARGLDIPAVDYVLQFDPPNDPKEYIHRVGRTARGEGKQGRAMLVIRPEEQGFLEYLHEAKVPLLKCDFKWDKLIDMQTELDMRVGKNSHLNKLAREAFKGYIKAYESHRVKDVFDIKTLNFWKICRAFGLKKPPGVQLNLKKGEMPGKRFASGKQKVSNFRDNKNV